jgi:glucose/arabinose dehydrogenase
MDLILRVAGTGGPGGGDEGPALATALSRPDGVAVTADGRILITHTSDHTVRMVTTGGGAITRVAGTVGVPGAEGDEGPATEATLNVPLGVAVTADGGFLIVEVKNNTVRKVSAAGVITRVAGTSGVLGAEGDGGPATEATLHHPTGLATTADGGFVIADSGNHTVRKVSAAGVITRVAGRTGVTGADGDYGPATEATLHTPSGLAGTADGGFLIADWGNHTIRKVSPDGLITRVAGTNVPGSTGDDGPATDAMLNRPHGVAATPDGGYLVADSGNHTIRKVSAAGVITRVAGTGVAGGDGDDGPANEATLHSPSGIAVTADGAVVIAAPGNHTVRMVVPIEG